MIEVEGLSKTFGWRHPVTAVDKISFRVRQGYMHALLGPPNAGKTTTLRMLATTLRPTAGFARIAGFDTVERPRKAREKLGYMPETTNFATWSSGLDYLRFWARVTGLSGSQEKARITELTEFLDIPEDQEGNPTGYTVGHQKRLVLAQALFSDPEILLLDEPLTGIGGEDRRFFLRKLQELRKRGKTLVLASSNMVDVQSISDQVSVLLEGQATEPFARADLLRQVGEGRHARIFVKADDLSSGALAALKRLNGVIEVRSTSTIIVIYVDPGRVDVPRVRETLEAKGETAALVEAAEITLGDVFRAMVREGS